MSDSNWNKNLGFIGSLIVALIVPAVIAIIIWQTSASITEDRIKGERYSGYYSERTSEQIKERCTAANPVPFQKCVEEIVTASHENQRDEADLIAQRQMAQWAYAVAVIGGLSIVLTVFGIWFVRGNLIAMQAQTQLARETMVAQTRPWLKFESVNLQKMWIDEAHVHVQVEFAVKNGGHSPALEVLVNPRLTIDSTESFVLKDTRREPLVAAGRHAGSTVFNGDYWPYPVSFSIALAEIEVDRERQITRNTALYANRPELTEFARHTFPPQFWIIANVQYEFVGSAEVHQTSVQFMIWKRNPDGPPGTGFTIPLDTGEVDLTHIELQPVGDVRAD
jgi:hypothetical protein